MTSRVAVTIVLLLAVTVGGRPHAQAPPKPRRDDYGLRGRVAELTESRITYKELRGDWVIDATRNTLRALFQASGEVTVRHSFNWSGSVASTTEYSCDDSRRLTEVRTLDSAGKITGWERCVYDENGDLREKRTSRGSLWQKQATRDGYRVLVAGGGSSTDTSFDRNGRPLGKTIRSSSLVSRWEHSYNAAGGPTEVRYYESGKSPDTVWRMSYDGRGLLREIVRLGPKGRVQTRREFSYDGSTLRTESVAGYAQDGSLRSTWTYRYDDRGNAVEEAYSDAGFRFTLLGGHEYNERNDRTMTVARDTRGGVLSVQRTGYDAEGRVVSRETQGPMVAAGDRVVTRYDRAGRLLETRRSDLSDRQISRETRRYDDRGNELSLRRFNPDDSVKTETRYVYDYDSQGNWVSREKHATDNAREQYDSLTEVMTRTIRYYGD